MTIYSAFIILTSKQGGTEKFLEYVKNKDKCFRFNHYKMLKPWTEVFGKENITVRVFEKESLVNNNLMHDFLHTIGIENFSGFDLPADQNISMDAEKLEFLRNLNFYFPRFIDNKINTKRFKLIKWLNQLPSGEKIPNNIVSLKAFYDSFTESNNMVANEFLGTSTLFRERETESLLPDEMLWEQNNVHQFFQIFSELWKLNARR